MKIQLDYNTKVLTLDRSVNFGELVEKIQGILPDWKEWKLDTQTTITYNPYPVVVREYRNPWWNGIHDRVYYNTPTSAVNLQLFSTSDTTVEEKEPTSGIYQLEIQ